MADTIWNNNYLLSNLDAQKLYAQSPLTTGVSGTSAYIGIEPSARYNETVLWSGNTRVISATSANPIQLSGSLYDYDRIAVYTKTLTNHCESKTLEFMPDSSTDGITLLTCFKGNGTVMRFGCAFMQYDSTGVYFQDGAFQLSLTGGTAHPTATNQTIMTKIVGINRKENT